MNRPSWDEYFKQIALVTKSRSPCERLQVGCLLVKDNRTSHESSDPQKILEGDIDSFLENSLFKLDA